MSAFFLFGIVHPMTDSKAPLATPILNLLQGQLESLILGFTPAHSPIEEQYLLARLGLKLHSDTLQSADLARFQQHFVLYHLLYRIQQHWLAQRHGYLAIGLAKLQLLPLTQALPPDADAGRQDYYLNWQNFYAMTEQLLDQHLDAFWQQLQRPVVAVNTMAHSEALALLGLPAGFTPQQLKKAYRTKALQLHPDRGGEQQQFILLQQAYQQLQQPG
ncbi:DnaJ domain-containing protein [Rheinheimera pacifica]|uniref:DnaJ domain-containing protein n=2 Tax=Rheinheimera pacifica TaxID=173990 RepID=A0A1H6N781_9GAMM|nr:DnaJ domain-containing protein [Rheinheimera pacifica]